MNAWCTRTAHLSSCKTLSTLERAHAPQSNHGARLICIDLCTEAIKLSFPLLNLGSQRVIKLLERIKDAHDLALDLYGRNGNANLG